MHDYCNIYLALASMGRAQEPQALSLQKQIEALVNSPDDKNRVQASFAIYSYSKRIGDYKTSLLTFEKIVEYQDSLFMQKIQQSILANQKEHYKMQGIQERNLRQMISVFSIFGALLLLSGILLLIQHGRQKRKQVEVAMSQIEEIQREYDRLSQNTLQKEINTLSQLAEEYYESGNKQQEQIIISHFKKKLEAFRDFNSELTFLENDINTYRNQAMEHFRAEFPDLSKHAYKMAVVFFAGLPNSLIGLLMNKSTPTVRTERSLLRKKISDSTALHKKEYLKFLDKYQQDKRSC
jgi:type II secretory pathway pseudopilin PulG